MEQATETIKRINFLYQAAVEVFPVSPVLAQYYVKQLVQVSQKQVQRM